MNMLSNRANKRNGHKKGWNIVLRCSNLMLEKGKRVILIVIQFLMLRLPHSSLYFDLLTAS